jgi:hypothetical protein
MVDGMIDIHGKEPSRGVLGPRGRRILPASTLRTACCLACPLATVFCSSAGAGTEQAISASAFINSIGVNTHFAYCFDTTQSYQTANFAQINPLLPAVQNRLRISTRG